MSYVKSIEYGDYIEIYEYEKSPVPHKRKPKDPDKEKPTEEEKYEKRKSNVRASKKNFKRLVAANLDGERPLLISLTYAENMQDIDIGYKDFGKFTQRLKYKFGDNFRYIAVPEFQKRGAVHFHALFWGLPLNAETERKERIIADIWGHGFIDIVETDGNEKISGYLAKYMAKAFQDRNLKNKKSYTHSKNIKKPIVDKNTMVLLALYDKVGETDKPEIDKQYETRWLGKGRFRLFKKIKNE